MAKRLSTKQKNIELAKEGKQLLFYALKLRIYPTIEQETLINKTFGCSRMIYNQYLSDRKEHYRLTGQNYKVDDYKKNVLNPQKKNDDYKFLKEVDKYALEFALESVQDAYNRFFSPQCKFPQFKSKKRSKLSYTTKNNKTTAGYSIRLLNNNTIQLPKLKSVSFAIPKSSKNNNKYNKLASNEVKITKKQSKEYIYDIKSISYKVSRNTLLGADLAIKHIKRNKKTYKRIVFLFALYMMPQFMDIGSTIIIETIRLLSNAYYNGTLIEIVYDLMKTIALYVVTFLTGFDIIKKLYNNLLKSFNIN